MIRVLHFADIVNRFDFIHNVLTHLDEQRFATLTVTLHAGGDLNRQPGGLRVLDLECRRRIMYPQAMLRLRALLKDEQIDVLHCHHFEPSLVALAASSGLNVAMILGRHYSDAIYQLSAGLRRRAYLALEGALNRRAFAVVAPSQAVAAVLAAQDVQPSKIARIPYGFDFSRFGQPPDAAVQRARDEWPPGTGLRIATFARLHPEKGHRYLIETLGRRDIFVDDPRWLVVGDGPEMPALRSACVSHGLASRVRFAGWRTDVLELMAAADIVVQPTLHEAFSQVMVETMAMGRPLVISDVSGVRDVVENGVSGMVVPARNVEALSAAILVLFSEAKRREIGAAAHARVRQALDMCKVIGAYEDIYSRASEAR